VRLRLLLAAAALAQRPVFDVDDFVAPDGGAPMFVFRAITGGVSNLADSYRRTGEDAPFVLVTNSFYWSDFQVDYKRSMIVGADDAEVQS
jgi:hypothetical protein